MTPWKVKISGFWLRGRFWGFQGRQGRFRGPPGDPRKSPKSVQDPVCSIWHFFRGPKSTPKKREISLFSPTCAKWPKSENLVISGAHFGPPKIAPGAQKCPKIVSSPILTISWWFSGPILGPKSSGKVTFSSNRPLIRLSWPIIVRELKLAHQKYLNWSGSEAINST